MRKSAYFKNLDRMSELAEMVEVLKGENEQSIKFLTQLRD